MTVYTPHPDYTGFRYNGPTYTGQTALCKGNLFVPKGVVPSGGWPCVLAPATSGWTTTWLLDEVSDTCFDTVNRAWLKKFLDNGYAVVVFSVTVPRSHSTGVDAFYNVPHTDTVIDIDQLATPGVGNTNRYGPAYTGNGIVHHPDETMPGDYSGGTHPYSRVDWPMAIKDAVAMLQYVIANADAMQIDTRHLIAYGQSAAAWIMWHVAGTGRDLAAETWPSGTGQETISTHNRFEARVLGRCPVWFRAYQQGTTQLTGVFSYLATPGPVPTDAVDYTNYDVGALTLSHDGGGANLLPYGAPAATQDANSPLQWITAASAFNKSVPTYIWNEVAAVGQQPFDKTEVEGDETDYHSIWYGAAVAKALAGGTVRFVATTQAVNDSLDTTVPLLDYVYPDAVVASADQPQDMMEWLGGALNPETWLFRSGASSPKTYVANKAVTFHSGTTTANTSWTELVPQNDSRFEGVWIQVTAGNGELTVVRPSNTDPGTGTAVGLKVKDAYSSAVTAGNFDVLFIPGTDAIWVKNLDEDTATACVAMEY